MQSRKGFTLIELVVVVMILGILAAVAAPKLLSTSGTATDNGVKQTLAVVRDAIERYAAEHGGQLPGTDEATFKSEIAAYMRGPFPKCPVGKLDASIVIDSDSTAIGGEETPTKAWRYRPATGEFIINWTGPTNDGGTTYDQL